MNRNQLVIDHPTARRMSSTLLNYSTKIAVFTLAIGGVAKLVFGLGRGDSAHDKGKTMSTSHNGSNGTNGNGHGSTLLKSILKPKEPVETKTDDFLEKARELEPEDYSKAFNQKVGGHSGFSASIRRGSR